MERWDEHDHTRAEVPGTLPSDGANERETGITGFCDGKKKVLQKEALEEFHKIFQGHPGFGGAAVQRRIGSARQEAQFGNSADGKEAC